MKCTKCGGNLNPAGECNLCVMFATGATPGGHSPGAWPKKSIALGCHRSQVQEMNQRNAAAGVAARYEADGTCVVHDRGDRRDLLKLEGMHDNNGGYGDE